MVYEGPLRIIRSLSKDGRTLAVEGVMQSEVGTEEMTEGNFTTAAKTTDVPAGQVRVFTVDGVDIALCNVDGSFYAIDDVCTHDGGPLDQGELQGQLVECPRHGAKFDVTDGRAVVLPAVRPVKTYAVQVDGDDVKVDVG